MQFWFHFVKQHRTLQGLLPAMTTGLEYHLRSMNRPYRDGQCALAEGRGECWRYLKTIDMETSSAKLFSAAMTRAGHARQIVETQRAL